MMMEPATRTIRERPILMSGDMVRATLKNRKSQTRRIMKWQPPEDQFASPVKCEWYHPTIVRRGEERPGEAVYGFADEEWGCKCPYGAPGDVLWVRETWSPDHAAFYPNFPVVYRADGYDPREILEVTAPPSKVYSPEQKAWYPFKWRQSNRMPRHHCRLFLNVVTIRAERLQDISDDDILAEGITDELVRGLINAAAKCKTVPEHWISGADESLGYCFECAENEVARLLKEEPDGDFSVGGGYDSEGDSIPQCETCGCRLSNCLTSYGAEEEFKHFLSYGCSLKHPDDAYSFSEAMHIAIWDTSSERNDLTRLMQRASFRLLWDRINGNGAWDLNPWVWVITFNRKEAL